MKRSIFEQVVALVNGREVADMETLKTEINAEWERTNEKRVKNQETYAQAREVIFNTITNDVPLTVKEIFNKCKDELPENFTEHKIQYAILHYWNNEIVKHENGRSAYKYTKK